MRNHVAKFSVHCIAAWSSPGYDPSLVLPKLRSLPPDSLGYSLTPLPQPYQSAIPAHQAHVDLIVVRSSHGSSGLTLHNWRLLSSWQYTHSNSHVWRSVCVANTTRHNHRLRGFLEMYNVLFPISLKSPITHSRRNVNQETGLNAFTPTFSASLFSVSTSAFA